MKLFSYLGMVLMLFSLGCAKPVQAPELPPMNIGVVGVIQPMGTTDLLAGYIPLSRVLATPEELAKLNQSIQEHLQTKTKRTYNFNWADLGTDPTQPRTAKSNNALAYWVEVGKKMGVDVLILPQVLTWQERQGSPAGATVSAEINLDFFLIDVHGEGALISRSHYQEKQLSLADNLLSMDTFLRRGGKWLTAQELATEATQKMIQEFGL